MNSEQSIRVGPHTVQVSNQDKVMFPARGITKGDVIEYYRRIADTMLPYTRGRPLTMQRFPDGIDGGGFYEKEAPEYFPDWIRRVSIPVEEKGESQRQITCDTAATLVYLADQACLTPHVWLSRVDELHHPDKLIFDLDPPDDDFEIVRFAARATREILQQLNLISFVMTTGSRGVHVVVPLDRGADFDAVRTFAHDVARLLAGRHPERITVETRKDQRGDRLFVDYLRNSYGQNSVAPYALRARPGAPVATPLGWEELDDRQLDSQTYAIDNIFRRLGQKEDPWMGFMRHARSLDEPRGQLDDLAS